MRQRDRAYPYAIENKLLVVCPEEAEIVKEIFLLYVEEGQTIRYITKKLNDEGVKREQRGNTRFSVFTERTVRSILKNPIYAGKIAYGRRHKVKVEGTNNETKVVKQDDESKIILVEGVHEAIVTPEMFSKAEARLNENICHRKTRSDSTTVYVGLSMMCYTLGKANKTCLGERQLSGLIGKELYCLCLTASCLAKSPKE